MEIGTQCNMRCPDISRAVHEWVPSAWEEPDRADASRCPHMQGGWFARKPPDEEIVGNVLQGATQLWSQTRGRSIRPSTAGCVSLRNAGSSARLSAICKRSPVQRCGFLGEAQARTQNPHPTGLDHTERRASPPHASVPCTRAATLLPKPSKTGVRQNLQMIRQQAQDVKCRAGCLLQPVCPETSTVWGLQSPAWYPAFLFLETHPYLVRQKSGASKPHVVGYECRHKTLKILLLRK
uniref:Uncharacterized protein n=1 Tax=Macaca mulatta TaxID=9544 RepID=A0A5F7ZVX6_MACMU